MRGTKRTGVVLIAAALLALLALPAMAQVVPDSGPFYNTWARTDKPVADGAVSRTWMWGPKNNTDIIMEEYQEAPGGMREVQYFDKARMEDNSWRTMNEPWNVTNGLLVVELTSGEMQVGDNTFVDRYIPEINVAGDLDYDEAPTYLTFSMLLDEPPFDEGAELIWAIDRDGNITVTDPPTDEAITAGPLREETNHRTASVFWEFMNSSGPVYENGEIVDEPLFENPYYATGFPISEAYWSQVAVNGEVKWVLTQAFERRVLTYTPDNQPGWQTEAGNVGLQYYVWRYGEPPFGDYYIAELSGDNEVPPIESESLGWAAFWVEEGGDTIGYQLSGANVTDATAAHIHWGPADDTGPVVVPLFSATEDDPTTWNGLMASGVISAEDLVGPLEGMSIYDLLIGMSTGQTYVNVHTEANPSGEVRGQIGEIEGGIYYTQPNGIEEPEAVETDATGYSLFWSEDGVNDLQYVNIVDNLVGVTAAHIHQGVPGDSGPVVVPLFASEEPVDVSGVLSAGVITAGDLVGPLEGMDLTALFAEMMTGNTYVNIHTDTNPSGELRGQIMMAGMPLVFIADLSGDNETTPVETGASGWGIFWVQDAGASLGFHLVGVEVTDATAAHIHLGTADEDGDVVVPLFAASEDDPTTWNGLMNEGVITADDLVGPLEGMTVQDLVANMMAARTYVNVHTDANPPGEIRGQNALLFGKAFYALPVGGNETTPVETTATGYAFFWSEYGLEGLNYELIVDQIENATAAHIHQGPAGANGPVVAPLFQTDVPVDLSGILAEGTILDDDLVGPLAGETVDDLLMVMMTGDTYTNIHTEQNPAGEIRDQNMMFGQ